MSLTTQPNGEGKDSSNDLSVTILRPMDARTPTQEAQTGLPVLYSFRRCPYAMRARMALKVSGELCELREVVLRDKPQEMLDASPKATVPVLVDLDGTVIDESFEVMMWALERNDPDEWLKPEAGTLEEMLALIEKIEGPFKTHLDRYKYANRYTQENDGNGVSAEEHRDAGMDILNALEARLQQHPYLFGSRLSLADVATAPFVRQFANTDANWFAAQSIPATQAWLSKFVESELFLSCMNKYDQWNASNKGIKFPH